jgi:hypothetical protein
VKLHETMEWVASGFEATGVAILIVGSLMALGSAAATLHHGDLRAVYKRAPDRMSAERFSWASRS